MGVPATHFHQLGRRGREACNLFGEALRDLATSVLGDVFHAGSHSGSSFGHAISSSSSSVARAASSSIFCRAKPTWSRTYSPTRTSSIRSMETRLLVPPTSTVAQEASCTSVTRAGTERHMDLPPYPLKRNGYNSARAGSTSSGVEPSSGEVELATRSGFAVSGSLPSVEDLFPRDSSGS